MGVDQNGKFIGGILGDVVGLEEADEGVVGRV